MKWSEIQLESLKKMFLNKEVLDYKELTNYKSDKKYKTYLNAMPQACNEAVNIIIEKEPIIKKYKLNKSDESDIYDLKVLIDDYKSFYDFECNNILNWKLITKNLLKITDWTNEKVEILYSSYPQKIDIDTSDDYKVELDESYARIIPLYIAGELYKDDDLTLSTVYMNEFFTSLNSLSSGDNFINNKIQTLYRMEI